MTNDDLYGLELSKAIRKIMVDTVAEILKDASDWPEDDLGFAEEYESRILGEK